MNKMIKTAILTTGIFASISAFAGSVSANGSAQVSVQSNGLIQGVAGAVKNTAHGVGHAAHHVGHAVVDTKDRVADHVENHYDALAEKRANAKKRDQERQANNNAIALNTQAGVKVGNSSVQANTGLNADRKQAQAGANVGVKILGINANVNTNAKVGAR